MSGFKKIFYDAQHNKIFHSFYDEEGEIHQEEIRPSIEYYVPDRTGKSSIRDIYGNPVILQSSDTLEGMKNVVAVNKTYESDLSEDIKFLQKTYKGKSLKADMAMFNICTIDIEVESPKEFPKPEKVKYPINLISVHSSKTGQIDTFGLRPYTGKSDLVKNYHCCPDEKRMLEGFILWFRKQKFDIVTGWNCKFFDIPYIINRCNSLGIEKSLSPINIYKENTGGGYHVEKGGYTIAGISILDGRDLYKNFVYEKQVSYSLGAIGLKECKEGKLEFEGTINTLFATDWNKFVEYNIQDVILTTKIEAIKKHIELAINFCYQALIPFERIFSSISLITGYVIRYLHERDMVYPTRDKNQKKDEKFPGAYVMAKEGFYKYLMNFDVKSMYPHMIMQFNISPETLVLNPEDTTGLIKTPLSEHKAWETVTGVDFHISGIYYRKEKGVLPSIVEKIFNERIMLDTKQSIAKCIKNGDETELLYTKYNKQWVDEVIEEKLPPTYYDAQQQIRKILINSIYGVLGNPYFNFYNVNNAIAVTLSGQNLIKYLSSNLNSYLKTNWINLAKKLYPDIKDVKPIKNDIVVLIDTDSNYICMDELIKSLGITFKNDDEFQDWTLNLSTKFFEPFFEKILKIYADKFNVKQIIKFEKEKVIKQKFILAKKKYVDEVIWKKGDVYRPAKIKSTGIEVVRTDTPFFFRDRIKQVIQEIFDSHDRDKVIEKMKKIYIEFLKADPADISIPKGVSDYQKYARPMEDYLTNGLGYNGSTPMHCRAAINYNYLITKNNLPYQPVDNGTKIKFLFVLPRKNKINQNVIGFIGNWPKEFNDMFLIDYESQWNRVFQAVIQRFFDVLKWGEISLSENYLKNFMEF
jgi:DNA polymerase elongation subunit (family B)